MEYAKLTQKATEFANRHVGRNCLDGHVNQTEWSWYQRLYFRFIAFHLQECLSGGICENAFGLQGIIEERAEDWLHENKNFHCERGAVCVSGRVVKELYIEVIKENLG